MQCLVRLVLLLGLIASFGCGSQSDTLVIRNVTLIDGTGDPPKPRMMVLIDEGRITDVAPEGSLGYPSTARIIDGSGKYMIPGLWDMHVHLRDLDGTLALFIVNGVTSVRDMGSDINETAATRNQVNAGDLVGPNIKTSGMMLESPSWLGQYLELMREQGRSQEAVDDFLRARISVGDPEEARSVVDSLVALGADFIKVRHVESPEAFAAIARAAADAGIHFAGHYVWTISLEESVNGGQRSIEHNVFPGFDGRSPGEKQALFDALIRNDAHVVPTLVTNVTETLPLERIDAIVSDVHGVIDPRSRYVSRSIRANWIETVALDAADEERPPSNVIQQMFASSNRFLYEARQAGVNMLAGTDCPTRGTYLGFSLHDELALLVETYDMTPMEALLSATALPAAFMGMEDELGTVEAGKRADLVLLDADPLKDIANTRRIDTVIASGRVFDRAEREALLSQMESLVASSDGGATTGGR